MTHPITTTRIMDGCCKALNVEFAEVCGKRCSDTIVDARAIIAWVLRELRGMSLPEIARAFGKKCHSSAYSQLARIERKENRHLLYRAGFIAEAICESVARENHTRYSLFYHDSPRASFDYRLYQKTMDALSPAKVRCRCCSETCDCEGDDLFHVTGHTHKETRR